MSKLKKPQAKIVKQLDYSDCIKYLEKKYKFTSRDYANYFAKNGNESIPYLDFWHWLCDSQEVNNGATIYFDNSTLESLKYDKDVCQDNRPVPEEFKGWKSKIVEYILAEFGKGKNRACEFVTCW